MLTNESLRFVDDNTFQEAAPPEDRSRPLEWRRSFNTIAFEATDPVVEYVYSINEVDHFAGIDRTSDIDSKRVVTAAPRRRVRLTFALLQDNLRDSIFYTEETAKGSGIYQLRRPKGDIQVSFTEADPTEPRGPYAQGAFPGLAFKTDFERSSDSLCLEVGAPSHQLDEIAAELKTGYANVLHVVIGLQSFSYEVDDALREWSHPQDLFIHGSATQAVLLSIRLRRRQPETEALIETSEDDQTEQSIVAPLPLAPPPPPDYSTILKGIKTVLWVVAGLLLLRLLK